MLKLGPTPVNPALWPEAATQLSTSLRAMVAEVTSAWASEVKMTALRGELPVILFYVLIALILLARGRAVMERMTGLVLETAKGRIRALAGFAASLGQIIVPVLGIFLMTAAIRSTGDPG